MLWYTLYSDEGNQIFGLAIDYENISMLFLNSSPETQ